MTTVEPIEFEGFPKIARLYREIIITEKIDGTNAQVVIPEDPNQPVLAGSRKRWITPENDNYGFAAWVRDHEDELRDLGPGRHFGEWWGQGIQRKYDMDRKCFSLFNVSQWVGDPLVSPEYESTFKGSEERQKVPRCCRVVPILCAGIFSERGKFTEGGIQSVLDWLRVHGSVAAPGFNKPEGIVIFHTHGQHLFKVTLENDDEPKGKRRG